MKRLPGLLPQSGHGGRSCQFSVNHKIPHLPLLIKTVDRRGSTRNDQTVYSYPLVAADK
jgi:hypothetical protein